MHLGTDVPAERRASATAPTLVTVGHLVARKRHADVLRALWLLRDSHPALRWVVVGDGPERPALERLAAELGLGRPGGLHRAARRTPRRSRPRAAARVFVLPSVDEAFGVAYVEAMAAGVPAIGCRGEAGPEEIAAAGGGIRLVAPGDPEALAAELRAPARRRRAGAASSAAARARRSSARSPGRAAGEATVAAYEEALR